MYLMRLDDASEHWNRENWHRMHDLLIKYDVKPIVAIIPHNEDESLLRYPVDATYIDTIQKWVTEGWTPALHGYNHVYISQSGGINPVNSRSEFAGVSLDAQREKIRNGIGAIRETFGEKISPEIFVAPSHTFDENTLEALRLESDIRIISDTIANDVYYLNGFYFIPQQSGRVRRLWMKLVTFCYHPNNMTELGFKELEIFLEKHASEFVAFHQLRLNRRPKNILDRTLSHFYFLKRGMTK